MVSAIESQQVLGRSLRGAAPQPGVAVRGGEDIGDARAGLSTSSLVGGQSDDRLFGDRIAGWQRQPLADLELVVAADAAERLGDLARLRALEGERLDRALTGAIDRGCGDDRLEDRERWRFPAC